MFDDVEYPNVTVSDWETFHKDFPRSLIDEVIDRNEARLPNWFLPLARGVAIASDELLRQAGYHEERYQPRGWRETSSDFFQKGVGKKSLIVCRCNDDH